MRTKHELIKEMLDEALTCYCMKCATCLEESDYNRVNHDGKRFVAMITGKANVVVMRNHYTCSWCGHGLDIRDAAPKIMEKEAQRKASFYYCPTCQKQNRLKLYKRTKGVMANTKDEYHVLGGEL